MVKEQHNIPGFQEPQGAEEIKALFQQGGIDEPPSDTVDTMIRKKQIPPIYQDTGSENIQ
jgi:hypothetical protein